MLDGCVVNKLILHHSCVFEVGWLITTLVECISFRGKTCQAISLAENNFTFYALNVASIAYINVRESYLGTLLCRY